MTAIDDLVSLHDGRPGVRTLMQVEAREAEGSPLGPGASASVLDFIASTATLDRYHEVIEPAGWRLESYRFGRHSFEHLLCRTEHLGFLWAGPKALESHWGRILAFDSAEIVGVFQQGCWARA
jgi:hypothetical protein